VLGNRAFVETGDRGQVPDPDPAIAAVAIHVQRMRIEHQSSNRRQAESTHDHPHPGEHVATALRHGSPLRSGEVSPQPVRWRPMEYDLLQGEKSEGSNFAQLFVKTLQFTQKR
jgi:hypothetical protein